MHFARVEAFGSPPAYQEGPDLPPPGPDQIRLKVLAAAVHRLVQLRATGKHYSAPTTPVDPSSDGVGVDEATGALYYIGTFAAPNFAEYVNVDRKRVFPLPAGADAVTAAALANPISSAWMALSERAPGLPPDFSVLILGATGTSGRAAVHVARRFGAARVVGAARNEAALKAVDGLDGHVVLRDPVEESDWSAAGPQVDVVLDYVYGRAAASLLAALRPTRETRFVNIGTMGGEESIALPAQTLRSKMVTIDGAGPGAWSLQAIDREMPRMLELAAALPRPADVFTRPLSEVAAVWDTPDARKKRLVLVP